MTKALTAACAVPWAITEEWLQTILEIAARENPDLEAVAAKLGRPLDYTHTVTVRDGIATIPVEGPIMRYANLFSQISGATSVEQMATDLETALADPSVRGIILHVDSPGGEVNGVSEFADMVLAARTRKPVIAYVSSLGASAAYWIASAADELVLADTACVGSIGVVAAISDPKAQRARDIQFVSSQSPNKRPDPTTGKGAALIQQMVDDLAAVFVDNVARNRGVTTETVLADFGQGSVLVGQKAVDAGLADRVGSYEAVHAQIVQEAQSPMFLRKKTVPMTGGVPVQTVTGLVANSPLDIIPIQMTASTEDTEQFTQEQTMPNETKDTTAEDLSQKFAESEAENARLKIELEGAAKPTQFTEADIKRFREIEAENATLKVAVEQTEAQAKQAAEQVAAWQRENRLRSFAETARSFTGDVATHVRIMDALPDAPRGTAEKPEPSLLDEYVQQHTAFAEQAKTAAIFTQFGRSGQQDDGSAESQIHAFAERAVAEGKAKNVAEGYKVVLSDPANRELYARSVAERTA